MRQKLQFIKIEDNLTDTKAYCKVEYTDQFDTSQWFADSANQFTTMDSSCIPLTKIENNWIYVWSSGVARMPFIYCRNS